MNYLFAAGYFLTGSDWGQILLELFNRIDIIKHFKIEDELNIAQLVMKELYPIAGRPLPKYFPERPAEEMFDKNWDKWRKSIQLGKMSMKYKTNTVQVKFPSDMRYEITPICKHYPRNLLPKCMAI